MYTKQLNQATDLIKMFKCDSCVKLIGFLCVKDTQLKWMDRVGITQFKTAVIVPCDRAGRYGRCIIKIIMGNFTKGL